ncbi:hypothetical protein ACFOZ1_09810 [Gracilibacillus marinus]|jgi:hypothetical protein|uniref:Uncharacterized protein n=1 Tax=Gracilibacillus marinus TaxID=630535 RepID=A0ABV8VUD8_9BACI
MISFQWIDFQTDTNIYTQDTFEQEVGDTFEALFIEEGHNYPAIIWTTNYVILIKASARMYQDITFVKVARHPTNESNVMHYY